MRYSNRRAIRLSQFLHSDLALNFNVAQTQTKDKTELSSFPFMNMFVPTDILTGLNSFFQMTDFYGVDGGKNTVADITPCSYP